MIDSILNRSCCHCCLPEVEACFSLNDVREYAFQLARMNVKALLSGLDHLRVAWREWLENNDLSASLEAALAVFSARSFETYLRLKPSDDWLARQVRAFHALSTSPQLVDTPSPPLLAHICRFCFFVVGTKAFILSLSNADTRGGEIVLLKLI